ncbi:hypothetical protein [Citrobacter freundii]|uniref:hypothetical protein n=1 Tax=Citrobacter freundii TaxID=546 RepID=UPI00397ABE5B
MKKPKPLTRGEREVIRKLATVIVCADVEVNMIAKFYEEKLGKPYDRNAPDSYLNTFLNSDPECKRLNQLLKRDIETCRNDLAEGLGRELGK